MEKEKIQVKVDFHAPYINNGGTMYGDIIHYHYGDKEKSDKTGKQIREALEKLMSAKKADGKFVFTKDYQWYGVMRVLSEFYNYPSSPKDFNLYD